MVQPCPANVGDLIEDVDTPALIVDLAAYERNLACMADMIATKSGAQDIKFRPHAKTHKSPVIALDQMALGAVGVCSQKVSEAEVLVHGGVRDIYLSNEVIGRRKTERLAALAKMAKVAVCVDDLGNIAELSAAAQKFDTTLRVMVEIDVGMGRCGVPPGQPALELARAIDASPGLHFGGLQAYHGSAQHVRPYAERRAAIEDAARLSRETAELLAGEGLPCDLITGGGTGSSEIDLELNLLGELQAGSYVFMDADYGSIRAADDAPFTTFEHSLFVRASIISVPESGTAVLDAGLKSLAFDSGMPKVWGHCGITYISASDEHGKLEVSEAAPLLVGETIMLIPGHCDPTVNLYDWFVGVRDGVVERVWPVAARGALT